MARMASAEAQLVLPTAAEMSALKAPRMVRGRAALRLLSAERSEEILPVLLEEIVALGFARAAALTVDFESGEVRPTAALNCTDSYLSALRTSLWAGENPIVAVL